MKNRVGNPYGLFGKLELGLSPRTKQELVEHASESRDSWDYIIRESIKESVTDYYSLLSIAKNVSKRKIEQRVREMQKEVDYLAMQRIGISQSLVNLAKSEYELLEHASTILLNRNLRDSYDKILAQANPAQINNDGASIVSVDSITETMGVEEAHRLIVVTEGPHDVSFLKIINQLPEFKSIFDFKKSKISFWPIGGSQIMESYKDGIFDEMCFPSFYLFDSDIGSSCPFRYKEIINDINSTKNKVFRNSGFATQTKLRQLENYIPWKILQEGFKIKDTPKITPELDVITTIARSLDNISLEQWKKLTKFERNAKLENVKYRINYYLVNKVTASALKETGVFDEIASWYKKMGELYSFFV